MTYWSTICQSERAWMDDSGSHCNPTPVITSISCLKCKVLTAVWWRRSSGQQRCVGSWADTIVSGNTPSPPPRHFSPDNRGSMFPRRSGIYLPVHKVLQPRRPNIGTWKKWFPNIWQEQCCHAVRMVWHSTNSTTHADEFTQVKQLACTTTNIHS
jgi:hypothetical protein